MKKFYMLSVILGIMMLSSPVFAAGYGDAGCGLGSIVFGDSEGPVQILAATTNATGIQSFGISSGTSNCDAEGWDTVRRDQEVFVAQNLDSLSKEMATGEGESLVTLAGLLGCSQESVATFTSFTQQNYESIFESEDTTSTEILNTVKKSMLENLTLSASCTNAMI